MSVAMTTEIKLASELAILWRQSTKRPLARVKSSHALAKQRSNRPAIMAIPVNQFTQTRFDHGPRGISGIIPCQAQWHLVIPLKTLGILSGQSGQNCFVELFRGLHNGTQIRFLRWFAFARIKFPRQRVKLQNAERRQE